MIARAPRLQLTSRPGHPDFLDLDWDLPLADWQGPHLVEVARGVHRHVVRFVDHEGALYALKELPPRIARREYRLLRRMAEANLPVVEAVGIVGRGGDLEDVLITRFLDFSLPYRALFTHRRPSGAQVADLYNRLLDALVVLLVRLHLSGFFWGDCSLSNTLFRRDAGALAAYLVDAETGEWHAQLTDGQRRTDLEVTEQNVAGGLMDVQAELGLPPDPDPLETALDLTARYERLWAELTEVEEVGPDERYRVEARVRRLNELGFDIDELELARGDEGGRISFRPVVTERGHHRRRLFALTGLEAQENQARSLLRDLANFKAATERREGRILPDAVAAHRWRTEVFAPTVEAVPSDQRGKLEDAELFHEVIEHKWYLSEQAGADVGVREAVTSYMSTVLPGTPEERRILADSDGSDTGYTGYG